MKQGLFLISITLAAFSSLASCNQDATDTAPQPVATTTTTSSGGAAPVTEALLSSLPNDINHMGSQCTAAIGMIRPFSCLDGEIIPIQVDGISKTGSDPLPETCDRPSWLGGKYTSGCHPNARVGRLPNLDANGQPDDDVQNIFICRRYSYVESPQDPYFEDVAIIQHRKSTGDTCFFQHEPPADNQVEKINASRVPPPAEPADKTPETCKTPSDPNARCKTAEQFWLPPVEAAEIGCPQCHASGPFIRSPYISQVLKDGEPVVYPVSTDAANNYRLLGAAFNQWNPPKYIRPEGNKCVTCHVAGHGTRYARLLAFSIGQTNPPEAHKAYCEARNFFPPFSAKAQTYPDSHWMPMAVAHNMTLDKWREFYADSVGQILACLPTEEAYLNCLNPIGNYKPLNNTVPADCNIQTFGPAQ